MKERQPLPYVRRIGWYLACAAILSAGPVGAEDGNPARGTITHHSIHASIDPATANLAVVDTITIAHAAAVSATEAFPMLLARSLELREVSGLDANVKMREGRLRPKDYWDRPPYDELDGFDRARTIYLELDGQTAHWPETLRVVVQYAGTVYDSLRAPDVAYARGFETTSGLIDPRGAFLSWGTFWVPQRPEEWFTFRCALETPDDWHGVSQGALASSAVEEGMRTNIWNCPHPMEEIYLIAGPYLLRQETRAGVEVMTFTYEKTKDEICQRYIDGTERYLRLYGERIGPYPFAKFALVENFWQTGFGMPSFTLLGDRVIRLPFILDTSYGHEILHNWWGNGVYVDYESGNWCEGLTVYGADYLYKLNEGTDQARDYRRTALQGYADYVSEAEEMPLRLFRQRHDFATQALGYSKAMMVCHQVHLLLGEQGFWKALRAFYSDQLWKRASWEDLFAHFGTAAGRDLSGWKEQWIDRAGAPSLAIKDHQVKKTDKGYDVSVTISQTQPELYELLVPVFLGWNEPAERTKKVVALSGTEATVEFHAKRRPDWIAADQDYDVLRRIDSAEIPPALSRVLGADTAAVIVASGLAPELTAAYKALAEQWSEGARLAILNESELSRAGMPELPVWFFGLGQAARLRLRELADQDCRAPSGPDDGWTVRAQPFDPACGVVLAGGPPDRPQKAWSLIEARTPEEIAALGRKVPHYGKYGYLVFEESQNIAKGSWEIISSPLRINLAAGGSGE